LSSIELKEAIISIITLELRGELLYRSIRKSCRKEL
jgi:hypothetical protein